MAGVIVSDSIEAGIEIDCLIIGGGAAGLTAALAASAVSYTHLTLPTRLPV